MKVAVIEDNEGVAALAETILHLIGHTAVPLLTPTQFLNLDNYKGVDVCIIDLMMPEVSGETVLELLHGKGMRLIVWTAKPLNTVSARVHELADKVLSKGEEFSVETFREALG